MAFRPTANSPAEDQTTNKKKRNIFLFIIGIVLLALNGLILFIGLISMLANGFHGGDISLLIFFSIFLVIGIILTCKNKKPKSQNPAKQTHDTQLSERISESDYLYHAEDVEPTYITVHCQHCGALNKIPKGSTAACEYCGSFLKDETAAEPRSDANEATVLQALVLIDRLVEAFEGQSSNVYSSLERFSVSINTHPNPSMPVDVVLTELTEVIRKFCGETAKLSGEIRVQIQLVCDRLRFLPQKDWQYIETATQKMINLKNAVSKSASSIYLLRHSVDELRKSPNFRTRKIRSARKSFIKQTSPCAPLLESVQSSLAECLRQFQNAQYTAKVSKINQ